MESRERKQAVNTSNDTSMSDLPRRLEQAVRDESPSAVAALFTDDGSFWIADERVPSGMAAVGKDEIEQLFTSWFSAIQLQLNIAEASHSADAGDGQVLQSGVFSRMITVRETGDQVEERGGYVRLVTQVNDAWKYRALSVVVLPPSG